jgi:hypothetical protein
LHQNNTKLKNKQFNTIQDFQAGSMIKRKDIISSGSIIIPKLHLSMLLLSQVSPKLCALAIGPTSNAAYQLSSYKKLRKFKSWL